MTYRFTLILRQPYRQVHRLVCRNGAPVPVLGDRSAHAALSPCSISSELWESLGDWPHLNA
ncbi:hypothetical protein E2C01_066176 [Portunus trituberculatus]|uniref:Uncharacterized protein n=1 Tax=Portunus trituberculatus TaxID=210409 RepID=A0A5B7HPK5_PORTR|nr:hypothetical protein [Portunus trituberculatus]